MRKTIIEIFKEIYIPYVVAGLLIVPSLLWIFNDNTPWPWDQAWYGEVSVNLYYLLTNDISLWPKAMITAFGMKAPAIAWFGQFFVPLSNMLGSVDRALMMQIIFVQFLSLVFIYKIILFITNNNKKLALLGMLILSAAPLFVGMGHQYFVESLQLFAVIFIIFIFINIGVWNKYNTIIAFIIAFSYAMLVKITSPLYVLFIVFFGFFNLIKFFKKEPMGSYFKSRKNIILYFLGISFCLAAATWYIANWNNISQFMKLASSGSAAELYGSRDSFLNKFNLWFSFFDKSFFVPIISYIVYFTAGVVSLLYILKIKDRNLKRDSTGIFFISLASIILVLLFFSFQINEENRYLLPLLPYVIIIICLIMYKIKNNLIMAAFALLFFSQYIYINGITLSVIKNKNNQLSGWVIEQKSDKNNLKNIKSIINHTCTKESGYKINMVGVEFPWLNANTLEYYATQSRLESNIMCYYTSLGYAENNPENAWKRLGSINPPFFIISSNEVTKNLEAFNMVSSKILERIEKNSNFTKESIPSLKNNIIVFKNNSISK